MSSSKKAEKVVLEEKGNVRRDASDVGELFVGVAAADDGAVRVPDSVGAPERRRDSSGGGGRCKSVPATNPADEKENLQQPPPKQKGGGGGGKKVRLLSRYFQMHKKLCLPLPSGLFGRGRLYKAQSCGSIVRDRVNPPTTATVVLCGDERWRTMARPENADGKVGEGGDVNMNRSAPRLDSIVPLVTNCPGITMCNVHLGDVSKCCHLC